jgi:SWI/SNF-related matrix-associated actin-dependent regulator of chromatin subfamily A3
MADDVCLIGCKIVGVNYYRGIATVDESLLLVRELRNAYDANAIRVDNVANIQVGQYFPLSSFPPSPCPLSLPPSIPPPNTAPYLNLCPLGVYISGNCSIPRDVAATLAPHLDSGKITIEGTVVGNRNTYNIPISIQLFTPTTLPPPTHQEIQTNLRNRGLDLEPNPVLPGTYRKPIIRPPPPPASRPGGSQYNSLLQNSVVFDSRSLRDATEKFGLSLRDLEGLERALQPKEVETRMLGYQLQGLLWMMRMEHPSLPRGEDEVKQFWTRRGNNWLNVASNLYPLPSPFPLLLPSGFLYMCVWMVLTCISMTSTTPELARGGILADDMGLGKTLQYPHSHPPLPQHTFNPISNHSLLLPE